MSNSTATETAALHMVIERAKKGLETQNKKMILQAYDQVTTINLEIVDPKVFDKWDNLISQCNDFLYEN